MTEKQEQTAKSLYYMLSAFRESIGEPKYEGDWESKTFEYKELILGGISLVIRKGDITPSEIHDYWANWSRQFNPDHPSIIPFSELSETEKKKDSLFIALAKTLTQIEN
jgi:hypothetical protein